MSSVSRRSLAKGLAWGGAAVLGSAVAATPAAASFVAPSAQMRVIKAAKSSPEVAAVLAQYRGFDFLWDKAHVSMDRQIAWVSVVGSQKSLRKAVYVTALTDVATAKVLLVEHALLEGHPGVSDSDVVVRLAFDNQAPV